MGRVVSVWWFAWLWKICNREAVQELQSQNIAVVFTGLQGQPLDMFKRINLIPGLVNEEYAFSSFAACRNWLMAQLKDEKAVKKIIEDQRSDDLRISDEVDEVWCFTNKSVPLILDIN